MAGSRIASVAHRWLAEVSLALLLTELLLRFVVGIGNVPLFIAHPFIEYLPRPDQNFSRFARRYETNEWGMRSASLALHPADPDERRFAVLGDSVVNGGLANGAATDQAALATSLLEAGMHCGDSPVRVLNISAPSWGPENQAAYLEGYGLFGVESIVLVLSTHDIADVPDFSPLGLNHPTSGPAFAIGEGISNYARAWSKSALGLSRSSPPRTTEIPGHVDEATVDRAREGIRRIVRVAGAAGVPVTAVLHKEVGELASREETVGQSLLIDALEDTGINHTDLAPLWRNALQDGAPVFADHIHLTEDGQRLLAQPLFEALHAVGCTYNPDARTLQPVGRHAPTH